MRNGEPASFIARALRPSTLTPQASAKSQPAGFMALIVRIVKNIFQQAIDMKAELDLTI